ncbi:MAG TPA: sigma 54-interacting transcriptional regulator, partial [Desulfopila sp.]|nr:sigma 54-interacting transcriptional regulator [Desulfopila sp.]
KEVRPIGASMVIGINVRIIAATARDLQHGVDVNTFRQDLYYRLNVISIPLPPLRHRLDDIPALCDHFIDKYKRQLNSAVNKVDARGMDKMFRYSWPGNIRELENIIQRGMVLADDSSIHLEHLPSAITATETKPVENEFDDAGFSLKVAQKKLEAKMIARALSETGGNKSQAAQLLEISYPSLLSKIKEYSL